VIAICDQHINLLGVRYNPKQEARREVRCPLCGGPLRALRPGERPPNVLNGRREVVNARQV
jgi:hypothetical protein